MIRKIRSMKNWGIFNDFSWSRIGGLKEFNDKNVIYGWNYSGKTTISRIFSSIMNGEMHPDFQDGNFSIITDKGQEYSEKDLDKMNFLVKVFNREYIDENLRWELRENCKWEPIAFDIGENVATRQKIKENQKTIEKIIGTNKTDGRIAKYDTAIVKFNDFEKTKFTEESRRIRESIFVNQISFHKGDFKRLRDQVLNDLERYIIKDSKTTEDLKAVAISTNNLGKISPISYKPKYSEFKSNIKSILSESPQKDVVIDILEGNRELYIWAKQGIEFEENRAVCSFCNNPIQPDRIKELNSYFSNASKNLRDRILHMRMLIVEEINKLTNLAIPTSKNDYVEKFRKKAETHINSLPNFRDLYIYGLKELTLELDRKEQGNIFNALEIDIQNSSQESLESWIAKMNSIIREHNEFIDNFVKEKNKAKNALLNHLVAKYLKSEKYIAKQKNADISSRRKARFLAIAEKLQKENDSLSAQLKNIALGKEKLNNFIQKFFNRTDIKVDVTKDEKFVLLRGKKTALNLSEGEKTAIAFSYFLVTLESLYDDGKLRNVIVFIDDPLSSLDNNHIAQIYSLINSFFFRKGVEPTKPDKVINCFKQLFISTHNFDFFSFLKDSSKLNKGRKERNADGKTVVKPSCNYYLVKRISEENSTLLNLPKALRLYKSEYVHLFEIIYTFHEAGCPEENENFILIPNAIRRFIEIYTLMKLPNETGSVETRINMLVDDVNQFKTLNYFSHFTSFEKITRHDDLIMNLPAATTELIDLLKKDPMHYDSLTRAIN